MMLTHYHGQAFRASEIGRSLGAKNGVAEHVGERETDAMRSAFGEARQHHARQDVAEAERAKRHLDVGPHHDRGAEQGEHQQREADADAEKHGDGVGAAVARLREPQAERPHFLRRLGRLLANPLDERAQRLELRLLFFLRARAAGDAPDFSARIRDGLPPRPPFPALSGAE